MSPLAGLTAAAQNLRARRGAAKGVPLCSSAAIPGGDAMPAGSLWAPRESPLHSRSRTRGSCAAKARTDAATAERHCARRAVSRELAGRDAGATRPRPLCRTARVAREDRRKSLQGQHMRSRRCQPPEHGCTLASRARSAPPGRATSRHVARAGTAKSDVERPAGPGERFAAGGPAVAAADVRVPVPQPARPFERYGDGDAPLERPPKSPYSRQVR